MKTFTVMVSIPDVVTVQAENEEEAKTKIEHDLITRQIIKPCYPIKMEILEDVEPVVETVNEISSEEFAEDECSD